MDAKVPPKGQTSERISGSLKKEHLGSGRLTKVGQHTEAGAAVGAQGMGRAAFSTRSRRSGRSEKMASTPISLWGTPIPLSQHRPQ